MFKVVLAICLVAALYSQTTSGYELGEHLCLNPANPEVDHLHHFYLDDSIDLIIKDTDADRNGIIDIDEVRYELLARWTGDDTKVNRTEFIRVMHTIYFEDMSVAGRFFDCLDVAPPTGWLNEFDFLLTIMQSAFTLDARVDLKEFRSFLHQYHPHGCLKSKCKSP